MTTGELLSAPATQDARPSRRAPWLLLVLLGALAFLAYALPPYLTFDPARSRIPPPAGQPAYYPLLVAHITFGTVAMLFGWLQIWTGLRRRHPALHRLTGRVYVFGGVLPAGATALAVAAMGQFGPALIASNLLLALLWLACTLIGFQMGLMRRFAEHRRWMTRSYVLTFSIIMNRLWGPLLAITLAPQVPTTFNGDVELMFHAVAGLSAWLGWVVPLVAVEWWVIGRIERPREA